MNHVDRIQHPAAHSQETDEQAQPKARFISASCLDCRDIRRAEQKELRDIEFA